MLYHPVPTILLILATGEMREILPGSYAAHFACGEAISLDPYGREADAIVLCEGCARQELPGLAAQASAITGGIAEVMASSI